MVIKFLIYLLIVFTSLGILLLIFKINGDNDE